MTLNALIRSYAGPPYHEEYGGDTSHVTPIPYYPRLEAKTISHCQRYT